MTPKVLYVHKKFTLVLFNTSSKYHKVWPSYHFIQIVFCVTIDFHHCYDVISTESEIIEKNKLNH